MYTVKKENVVDIDFGSEIGRLPLNNTLSQALLKRVYESPNGKEYVNFEKKTTEPEQK